MRLFALLALVCVASAHNFVMDPPQRGGAGVASTTAVCGAAYAGPTQSYFEGSTFQATWSTNHADGNRMYVSIAKYTAGDTAFQGGPTNAAGPILYSADYPSSTGGTSDTRTVTVPTGSLGIHTFQWTWAGWYNCIDFNIYAQPPTGATPATVDPATLEPIDSDTLYLTRDGYGLFDITNGNLTCNPGYTYTYDDVTGALTGCEATGSADDFAIQVTLVFAMDPSALTSSFEDDLVAALAAALNANVKQFVIKDVVAGNTTGVTVTINIQPYGDKAASVVYTALLEQYNTPSSTLLSSPVLSSLDTTLDLVGIVVPTGSGSDSELGGTTGTSNTVAAAVMVPLAFIAIGVLAFFGRQPARSALQSATGSRSVTGLAACTAGFVFVLFLLILIATGSQTWSAAGDTTVGPFVTCTGSSCWNSLNVWPSGSTGLLNACRTFMLFSVFASIAALVSVIVVAADKAGAHLQGMLTFNYASLLFITICNFIAVCMWGAFANDYLGDHYGYGYAFAIANINWVIGVFLTITAYATSLNGDTSTGGKSVNSPSAATPQV